VLLLLFGVFCLLDIVLVALARDVWAIGRILFTIVVLYFMLQGRRWAKWLLVSICSLLAAALVALIFALGAQLTSVLIVGSWVMVGLSVAIAAYILINKDLHRYLAWQRKRQAY
jgi:hypothetical protein